MIKLLNPEVGYALAAVLPSAIKDVATRTITVTYTKAKLVEELIRYASETGEYDTIIEALCETLPAQVLLDIADEHGVLEGEE